MVGEAWKDGVWQRLEEAVGLASNLQLEKYKLGHMMMTI